MRIKCDLELRTVIFELENEAEAKKFQGKLIGLLFVQSETESLEKFRDKFSIEYSANSVKVSLVHNNYYFYGIPHVIRLALGQEDVDLKIDIQNVNDVQNFVLDQLAILILQHSSANSQFCLNVNWDGKLDTRAYSTFEASFFRYLLVDSDMLERLNKYFTIQQKEHHDALAKKIQSLKLERKYGDDAENSALKIQSLFRGHNVRNSIKSLKEDIAKAVAQNQFQCAHELLVDLKNGARRVKSR